MIFKFKPGDRIVWNPGHLGQGLSGMVEVHRNTDTVTPIYGVYLDPGQGHWASGCHDLSVFEVHLKPEEIIHEYIPTQEGDRDDDL